MLVFNYNNKIYFHILWPYFSQRFVEVNSDKCGLTILVNANHQEEIIINVIQ